MLGQASHFKAFRASFILPAEYITPATRFITCIFGNEKDSKVNKNDSMCKMARGEIVRFIAAHQIRKPEKIKAFDRLDYQ